jgi:hypothetical protein
LEEHFREFRRLRHNGEVGRRLGIRAGDFDNNPFLLDGEQHQRFLRCVEGSRDHELARRAALAKK